MSAAAPLRFGLPYSFLTPDLHFVPEIQRQLPGGIPSHLRVSKVYYSDDIQAIVEEFEDAKTLGQGAAEEWKKGLVNKGKEAMADAARWEKWEGQLRLGTDLSQALREYDRSSFPHHVEEVQSRSAGPIITQPAMAVNGKHTFSHYTSTSTVSFSSNSLSPTEFLARHERICPRPQLNELGWKHDLTCLAGAHPLPQLVHTFQQNGYGTPFQAPGLPFQQPYRPARNPQEVEEARQARRADIERRCKDLEPPLDPSVLQHIESFQAAMQITTPMTDAAWEVLKPRILAQREAAELAEHQRATQLAALQAAIPTNVHDEPYTKPAKEVYDKEYEHAQEPLRSKLGEYADDFINSQWNGGHMLDKDNSPMFAVQTMLHVRQRYFEDDEAGLVPPAEHTTRGGLIQGSPIPEAFLSLDNMKWVYDNKIRPHTDNHRRELFICAGCAEERKPKWFAFEGLIQHYGAKHTTAFSKGNIVVHWQTAEWPEHPPFHPNPSNWIKIDRRTSDYKDHGRARNTPQATHDGPFATPGSGKLLSENPFFSNHTQQSSPTSNGYYSAAQSYPTHHYYGAPSPHTVAYGYPYQPPVPAEPAVDMSYDTQINKLSSDAREIWDSLDGVKQLLECVRIQAMLHHVVTRFLERFRQNPNLDLVTDALATHTLVRPIKNAHGLACKLCVAGQTDGSADYKSYYARIRNVKLYNVSSLITHFKIVHQPQEQSGYFDWTKDMIELPETQLISDLTRAPGMDDDKLAIVAAAFPKAFETPLPKIGLVQEPPAEVGPESGLAGRLLDRMNKKPKQGQKKKGQHGANGTPAREESQEPMPEPKEDEYDPRRPMYLRTEEQASDPARFDTDVARRTSASTPSLSAGAFNLAPETLAALNNLNALTSQTQQPAMYERGDRSPSVGRAEPQAAPQKPTDGSANVQPPDITAILASLTGQPRPAQTATPPISVSARSGSAPRNLHADPYGQPQHASPRSRHEERPSSSRYAQQPAYRNSTEPQTRYDAQDLQAALTRNTRQFEHNQAKTYVEPTYAPPQRSPPRYWYVYDDGQIYSQAPQQPPVYHGHEAPVQYIQLPPDRAPPQPQPIYHQYEQRVAPKPVYVDEYGRPIELIPIDSAPAPVQYVPHPFEQQQQQQYARRPEGHVAYASAVPPPAQHLQPAYEDRRVYFEPAGPAPGGVGQRFVYDDGARSSVPRG